MKNKTNRNTLTHKLILIISALLVFTAILGCTTGTAFAKKKKVTVKIGHARIDEKGTTVGKKPGDQKGSEVAISSFHYSKNSWAGWIYAARCNDPETAKKIAKAVKQACKNNNIGYGKSDPQLASVAASVNYDLSKVKTPVNCDCIGLVDVCLEAAGVYLYYDYPAMKTNDTFKFYTKKDFIKTGKKLQPGDILYTRSAKAHHVAVVTKSGNKVTGADPKPASVFKKGQTYTALRDLYLYRGPGSYYYGVNKKDLSKKGKKLVSANADGEDYYDELYIHAGTSFVCKEARRNFLKTDAGWVRGVSSSGEALVS